MDIEYWKECMMKADDSAELNGDEIILRCTIPVVFYANYECVGTSKHNCLFILFIRLTKCFGHCGPSSGH